jgi:UDP-glucose:(heptosyl)LPS alpha-1,3-glucosyltransferase
MRVALSFPGCFRRGGVERIVYECARYLAAKRHEVDIYANQWEVIDHERIRYHRVPALQKPRFLRGWSYFRNATRQLVNAEFDVLNTHGSVCPTGGIHWAQSLHVAWLDRARQFRSNVSLARWKQRVNPLHPILLRLEKHHFRERAYRHVIVTTAQVRSDLADYYGVPCEDVTIIPNGFAPDEFHPEIRAEKRRGVREKLGLREDNITLLFVANELERKGYRTILQAMRILGNRQLRLLVVGGVPIHVVQAWAAEYGLEEQVLAHGSTSNVADYHAASDLFVLPTQYEAFCLAILESLGSGLPVITSNVPGASDAIVPGKNGKIISDPLSGEELAAALKPLLDMDAIAALSATTPATAESYQWPRVLQQYEEVLKKFVKS